MLPLSFAWLAALAFAGSLGYFAYMYSVPFGADGGGARGAMALLSAEALVNYALFTGFALHHSLFARPALKRMVERVVPASLERSVYVMVASALFIAVCAWWQAVPGTAWTLPGPARAAGYAAQAAGVVITLLGARALDALELAGVRQAGRRPLPSRPLKVDGVYGLVRHPLYFAWVLLVFGAPDMTMTRLSFALVSTLYLMVAIPFEERGLVETFGAGYASYRGKVRWRMLPGLY